MREVSCQRYYCRLEPPATLVSATLKLVVLWDAAGRKDNGRTHWVARWRSSRGHDRAGRCCAADALRLRFSSGPLTVMSDANHRPSTPIREINVSFVSHVVAGREGRWNGSDSGGEERSQVSRISYICS
jgi:hypothetical protein